MHLAAKERMNDLPNPEKRWYSRREFLITTGALGFATLGGLTAYLTNYSPGAENVFEDDFHYFNDNLTNLHFYFIDARIDDDD